MFYEYKNLDFKNFMYFVTKTLQVQAVVRMCSVKKVLLKILQNSQENTCVKVSFLIKLQLY